MGAKSGRKGRQGKKDAIAKSGGRSPIWLIGFGVLFVALFVVFAVAEGLGQPSVPDGDIALVQNAPEDFGHISEAEFRRSLAQQIAQAGTKKPPKPGSDKYEEVKENAVRELLEEAWIAGEAEELGITVTDKQIADELATIKKSNFPTEKAFQEFLKTSHFSEEDVNSRVRLQLLSSKVQEEVNNGATPPTSAEIQDFYDTQKATQFTTKPTRDIRLVINPNKAKVEAAKEALDKDNSPANWKKVATKYSSDPTSKAKGGLQPGISEELLTGPLKKAVFGSATGEVVGPINFQKNFLVIEVVKLNPEKVKALAEVKAEISKQLTEQIQQSHFAEFVADYQSKWRSRSFCAEGYVTEQCANFKGSGHPTSAPPACYEADPKTPAKECPAPVEQVKPALPGTTTLLKPQGERLAQRPQPAPAATPAAGAGTTLPEGATPPTGEAAPPTGE